VTLILVITIANWNIILASLIYGLITTVT